MKVIILNSSNYVAGSNNSYIYTLPSTQKFTNKSKIGVMSLSVYNSTFNIQASRGNNTLTFIWSAATPVTYNWTIPDSYMAANDLNNWFQSQFIANNLYVTVNNGNQNVYFFEIVQNSVRYSLQLNAYFLPTSATATTLGYTQPSGATWSYPTSNKTPQLTFNSAFGNLIGFSAQTYP